MGREEREGYHAKEKERERERVSRTYVTQKMDKLWRNKRVVRGGCKFALHVLRVRTTRQSYRLDRREYIFCWLYGDRWRLFLYAMLVTNWFFFERSPETKPDGQISDPITLYVFTVWISLSLSLSLLTSFLSFSQSLVLKSKSKILWEIEAFFFFGQFW